MCDRPRDMGGNVFPPLLESPYFNVLSVGSCECKCSMMPRNDGNYQAHSWATYTFIRLWLCAMVREKMTKKWFLSPTSEVAFAYVDTQQNKPRQHSLSFNINLFSTGSLFSHPTHPLLLCISFPSPGCLGCTRCADGVEARFRSNRSPRCGRRKAWALTG